MVGNVPNRSSGNTNPSLRFWSLAGVLALAAVSFALQAFFLAVINALYLLDVFVSRSQFRMSQHQVPPQGPGGQAGRPQVVELTRAAPEPSAKQQPGPEGGAAGSAMQHKAPTPPPAASCSPARVGYIDVAPKLVSLGRSSLMSVATPTPVQRGAPRPVALASLLQSVLQKEPGSPSLGDDYTLGQMIGEGAYAMVRLVEDFRSGELFACKSIAKAHLQCAADVADVVREVEILNLLSDHPNITRLRAVYEDQQAVHMVMDYCAGGELFDRIIKKGTFSEAEAAKWFRQMVEVVHACHSVGVIHRDIKLENFLLTSIDDKRARLEVCDFGLSCFARPGQRFSEIVGTPYYLAPEVLGRNYSFECDLWSLGVVLFMLLSGFPPFRGNTVRSIFQAIQEGAPDYFMAPWPWISQDAKDIVQRLLTVDPSARATTEELLQHPWLVKHGVAPDRPLDSIVIMRMKAFAGLNRLKKAAVLAASKYLSLEQMEGLRQLFQSFDTNGDGVISLDELREGLRCQGGGMTETELLRVMQETDVDGSGCLDYEEFLAATVNVGLLLQEEVLMKAFQELDTDGSGYLSADEVAVAIGGMEALPSADVLALIEQFDENRDGVLDYAEFIAMLRGPDSELKRAATLRCKGVYVSR